MRGIGRPVAQIQQSDDPNKENPGQASGDWLHVPCFTREVQPVTEPEASHMEDDYWIPKRKQMPRLHLHATSSIISMSRHRETDWQSKEDVDMTYLLSPGVKLLPNWVTRIEENLMKTFGKLNLTHFQVNTATWCTFARYCMWASFQMSRSIDTCTRDCQNYSISNTQDILTILTGSFLENEQNGEPSILRDGERLSSKCLTREKKRQKPSISRRAKWEHAHTNSAYLLRLNLLHRPRFAEFHQCFRSKRKNQKQS